MTDASANPEPAPTGARRTPTISSLMSHIAAHFEQEGVLGAVLIDAKVLREVEVRHGHEARRSCLEALATRVREVASERLEAEDVVCIGESGQHELLVLFFRSPGSATFFRSEMPGFITHLGRVISAQSEKIFYPFRRSTGVLPMGMSVAVRNPQYGIETQLRGLLEEAREDADLGRRLVRRAVRRDLIETILDQKVYSVYEPIVEVKSRTVFGYEALVRGEQGGALHSPFALFGAAKEHGLVYELDQVCRSAGLRGAIDFPHGTKLFLNILPSTIQDPNFRADKLIRTLERCELSPSEVVFEISEQESTSISGSFREIADSYRDLGFEFALDDTGSGYAGFEELIELQPEYIKMDRSVVSGVDQDSMRQDVLAALLQIAEKMGAKVIGEGLDTLEELEMLGELGIHFGQGWLFGKPHPLRADADE